MINLNFRVVFSKHLLWLTIDFIETVKPTHKTSGQDQAAEEKAQMMKISSKRKGKKGGGSE